MGINGKNSRELMIAQHIFSQITPNDVISSLPDVHEKSTQRLIVVLLESLTFFVYFIACSIYCVIKVEARIHLAFKQVS